MHLELISGSKHYIFDLGCWEFDSFGPIIARGGQVEDTYSMVAIEHR